MKLTKRHLAISLRSIVIVLTFLFLSAEQFKTNPLFVETDSCCTETVNSSCSAHLNSGNPFSFQCEFNGCCSEKVPLEIPSFTAKKISVRHNSSILFPKTDFVNSRLFRRFYAENSVNAPPYLRVGFLPTFTTLQLRTIRLIC